MLKPIVRSITLDQQKWFDSILESALTQANANLRPKSGNTTQPRSNVAEVLTVKNTPLVERSAEENLDYFHNADCTYNVFKALAKISPSSILTMRTVCKTWQEMIDGALFNCNGLLQQHFLVYLTIKQLIAFALKSSPNDNDRLMIKKARLFQLGYSSTDLKQEEWLKLKFVSKKNINTKIHLNDNNIYLFKALIHTKPQLKNIETISFGKIPKKNSFAIQTLLDTIVADQETLFLKPKKLIFGNIKHPVKLTIREFKHLDTLIFEDIFGSLAIPKHLPTLKRLEYRYNKEDGTYLKDIVNLKKIYLTSFEHNINQFSNFIDNPKNLCWLKCIETITITACPGLNNTLQLLDSIHSKQDLFANLNKIILFVNKNDYAELSTSESLPLPKFSKQIEVVYDLKLAKLTP